MIIYSFLVGLVVYLWTSNYFTIPSVVNLDKLIISVALLWLGFLLQVKSWQLILNKSYFLTCSFRNALSSLGLTVFGKYIPGKVWGLAGRAVFIAKLGSLPIAKATLASIDLQLIAIWSGMLLGLVPAFMINDLSAWRWPLFASFVLVSLFLVLPTRWALAQRLTNKISHQLSAPAKNQLNILTVLVVIVSWLAWSFGFYFLLEGFGSTPMVWVMGLGFAFAAVASIVAPLAPAGLGVREALIAGFLFSVGMSMNEATSMAIISRVWFVFGEVFIFILGSLAMMTMRKN